MFALIKKFNYDDSNLEKHLLSEKEKYQDILNELLHEIKVKKANLDNEL
jgi:hypothetical protein